MHFMDNLFFSQKIFNCFLKPEGEKLKHLLTIKVAEGCFSDTVF